MNENRWVIIVICVTLIIFGFIYIRPLFFKDDIDNAETDIVKDIEAGVPDAYSEYMYCERCILFPEGTSYSTINGDFEVMCTVYIDDSIGIEKVELKTAMEYDYIQFKDNYKDYIIKTLDITDSIVHVNDDNQSSTDKFTKYTFDVTGTMTEEEGFNPNRGVLDYAVVVTFNDGYQSVLFQRLA